LSDKTFVAQCTLGKGGTWSGTKYNLHHALSDVYVFADGSEAQQELCAMGANPVDFSDQSAWFTQQSSQLKLM
jgi:hypothetical protein